MLSEKHQEAIDRAKAITELNPEDALQILEDIYGNRLNSMKPESISKIMHDMVKNVPYDCSSEIQDLIENIT